MFGNCKEKEPEEMKKNRSTHSSIYPLNVIFFSFKKPKHDEENGDKEGSWKPPSGVNTTSVGQLANVLKQGIPTQLKSTKVCMYMYTHLHTHTHTDTHTHIYTHTYTVYILSCYFVDNEGGKRKNKMRDIKVIIRKHDPVPPIARSVVNLRRQPPKALIPPVVLDIKPPKNISPDDTKPDEKEVSIVLH